MKEDDTAITQDDSGSLHASTLVVMANDLDKAIKSLTWNEFDEWADDTGVGFVVESKNDFRMLQEDIVNGEYDVSEILKLRRDVEGLEDGEDVVGEKSGSVFSSDGSDDYMFKKSEGEDLVSKGWGSQSKYTDIHLGDMQYELEIASSPDERYTGMSKYDVEPDRGMLFVYPREQTHELVFRDMDFPVTAFHVSEDGGVHTTGVLQSPGDAVRGVGKYAIEIPGTDVGVPDTVDVSRDRLNKSLEKEMVDGYPDVPTDDTPEEVVNWLHRQDENYDAADQDEALLYQLLGSGTPEWKMSKEDADYKDEPEGNAYCGNCEYAYYSNQSGQFICSKIRGKVDWEGWCRLWDHAEPDEFLLDEFGVPEGVEKGGDSINSKGSDSVDSWFEKYVGGSNYSARKLREKGEQLSADSIRLLEQAHREQVWPDGMQKSPSWTGDQDVTEETQNWVKSIIELEDPMWDEYSNVPMAAGLTVKQELKESLTQPQGWSLDSIDRRLRESFPHMEPFERQRIARQEVSGILNRSKIVAIQARADDPLVKWVGPDDSDTTELCMALKEEIGNGVPFSEFMDLLKEYAEEFEGTIHRVDQGIPHFMCRHTVEMVEEDVGKYSPTPESVPDGAEYLPPEDDPPDGAEVVESDRGATYYLPVGHEEHSDQQAAEFIDEAEGELANEVGLDKDKVNLSGLSESDYGEELLESLADYAQRGWLDGADKISAEWDSQRFAEGGIGVTSRSTDSLELHLNPEAMTEDFFQRADEENGLVDPTPRGVVSHEVGHLRRYAVDEGINDINFRQSFRTLEDVGNVVDQIDFAEPWMEGMQEDDYREIAERVSQYAASSGAEFVAEVHAALVNGEDLDDEVMALYGVMGGPEVSQ